MNAITIPAPGGGVTLPRFGVMTFGAALGLAAYANFLSDMIPDSWEEFMIPLGPLSIKGTTLWMGASALLGGAAASMLFSRFSK